MSVKVSAIVSGLAKDDLQYMAKCIPSNQYRANFIESVSHVKFLTQCICLSVSSYTRIYNYGVLVPAGF